jgi:hypothetical protein
MRTARRVIVCLLILFAGGFLPAQQSIPSAQGSVDTDVTIMGSDDTVLPVTDPAPPDDTLVLPELDTDLPPPVIVPPVRSPAGRQWSPAGPLPPIPDAGAALPSGPEIR